MCVNKTQQGLDGGRPGIAHSWRGGGELIIPGTTALPTAGVLFPWIPGGFGCPGGPVGLGRASRHPAGPFFMLTPRCECHETRGMSALNPQQFGEAQYDTMYHLTDRADFSPDPSYVPEDNTLAIESRSRPGLYTGDPEAWINGHGYVRPFVAELKVPRGMAEKGRWGGESFIPGEALDKARVSRVIPTDAYARERYGAPGWIEDHHESTFDTDEPITRQGMFSPGTSFPNYKYSGPDAREMSPDAVKRHTSRAEAYRVWNDDPRNH